jgi:hypothetical protein
MNIKDRIIENTRNLSPLRNNGTSNHWDMVSQDIRNKIINDNLDNFLSWHNVVETMFVNSKAVAEYEYGILSKSEKWPIYLEAIKGLFPGNPPSSSVVPQTNNNALHQLYHLYMYEQKYGSILNAKKIVEFGGGYGCLCSIVRKLGFKGQYIIIDFPEFHLIQQYYLHSLNIWDTIQTTTPNTMLFEDATLFAFWSLSETEQSFKINFIDNYLSKVNNFLMAYQTSYEGQDNLQAFDRIKAYLPFNIEEKHLDHIQQNYYIFGDKK